MKAAYFRRQGVEGWLFILPVILGTFVFSILPLIYSFVMSFTNFDGINPAQFIGLENFAQLLGGDKYFVQSVRNTFVFSFTSVPFATVLGLILALLVNQKIKGVNLYRTAFFAPAVTSTIAIGLVWALIYSPNTGFLNVFLSTLDIEGPDWLGTSRWAMAAVVIVQVWWSAGYNMVIYLAGLQGIPNIYYEAATIDGASPWQQFRHITFPMLSPATYFILITSLIGSFQVFNLVYVLTQGGPAYATTLYIHYLYLNGFNYFKMGYASAMAWTLFLVLAGITFFQWRMQKRWVHYQ